MSYANVQDLETFIGEPPPAGAERLLDKASRRVDAYLVGVSYNHDTNGLPTDAAVITALNQATCAQVHWWLTTGDEMDDLTRTSQYTVEGITVSQRPPGRLCPEAVDILVVAQLLPAVVRVN